MIIYLSNFENTLKQQIFLKNIFKLESNIKLKQNILDTKIDILVKELEDIRRKEEKFFKKRKKNQFVK